MDVKPIIYFSAEYGLPGNFPIYAGGLGVLAGDILKEASDLKIPMVGIGLMYKKGFFRQVIDDHGNQIEQNVHWDPGEAGFEILESKGKDILVEIPSPSTSRQGLRQAGQVPSGNIVLKTWKYLVGSSSLYLLDSDTPENPPGIRDLTSRLYTGDWAMHLDQEYILGVGGVRLVRALGLEPKIWHLNDDHAALSLLERARELMQARRSFEDALMEVGKATLFTTHTPVKGAESLYDEVTITPYFQTLFKNLPLDLPKLYNLGRRENDFSFSVFGLKVCQFKNAVSKRHQEVSQSLWGTDIDFVINGVNATNWISPPMNSVFSKYLGGSWVSKVDDNNMWQRVYEIPNGEFWQARLAAKRELIDYLGRYRLWQGEIDPEDFFIGFARRFAPYKQLGVLISSMRHLEAMLLNPEQPAHLFVSGKAHPIDKVGKSLLKAVWEADHDPKVGNAIVFCENYDIELARKLVAGVDLWLNTPKPPMEASGTSGMKALINGVLNASTLDGWWYEAYDGNNGWVVGSLNPEETAQMTTEEINENLFYLLEEEIIPLYYDRRGGVPVRWIDKVKDALSTLAPKFNTRRMLLEYKEKFYDQV